MLIFSAFALIVVQSSFNFSKHEMVEVEEFQNENVSQAFNGPGYWRETYSSKYDSDDKVFIDWNRDYLPSKEIIRAIGRMETVVFAY